MQVNSQSNNFASMNTSSLKPVLPVKIAKPTLFSGANDKFERSHTPKFSGDPDPLRGVTVQGAFQHLRQDLIRAGATPKAERPKDKPQTNGTNGTKTTEKK